MRPVVSAYGPEFTASVIDLDQESSIASWDCFQRPNGSSRLVGSSRSGGWLIGLRCLSALGEDVTMVLSWGYVGCKPCANRGPRRRYPQNEQRLKSVTRDTPRHIPYRVGARRKERQWGRGRSPARPGTRPTRCRLHVPATYKCRR